MYIRKESYDTAWLKAERDLAISGYGLPPVLSVPPCSTDDILPMRDKETIKHIQKQANPAKLEDYQPGACKGQIFKALKKAARTAKPHSVRRGSQPMPA